MTKEKAISMLPDSEIVHTLRQSGLSMIGADWEKGEILKLLDKCEFCEPGAIAGAMKHGLAIKVEGAWLFVETKGEN